MKLTIEGLTGLDNCPFAHIDYYPHSYEVCSYDCNHPKNKRGLCCRDYITFIGCPLKNKETIIVVKPQET